MLTRNLPRTVVPIVFALVYFLAARASLQLAFAGSNASPIWPPTGIAIAAMTFWGLRLTPAVTLAAFAANLYSFYSGNPALPLPFWIASATIALGNTAEAVIGAWWLRRDSEFPALFHSQRSCVRFVLIAILASATSAATGTASLVAAKIIPESIHVTVGMTWWLGDLCGALIFVPLFASLTPSGHPIRVSPAMVTIPRTAISIAVIALISWLIFGNVIADISLTRPLVFLIFPALGWTAWQYGLRGACFSVIVIATFAVIGTTRGFGPFASGQLNESLILLDSFLAVIATTAVLLAADRLERAREGFTNTFRQYAMPGVVLLGAIGTTILAWHLLALENERQAEQRFYMLANDISQKIDERMHNYQRTLWAGAGLFATSHPVTRADWRAFHSRLNLLESLPGIQGLGFGIYLSADATPTLLKQLQHEGYPNFAIKPAGKREHYTPVLYLEPNDQRNQRAIGYDMMSESVRRTALINARDTGKTTMSGKVRLQQEDEKHPQPGFLMYEPVYQIDASLDSMEARRKALKGYVYAAFRAHDLMQGMLGQHPEYSLQIFDGESIGENQLLYASVDQQISNGTHRVSFSRDKTLTIFGRPWTIRLQSSPVFEASIDRQKSQFMFVGGGIVSLLLFAMLRQQSLTGARAHKLAEEMTHDLKNAQLEVQQREEFASSIFEATPEPLLLVDSHGKIIRANAAAARTFGYTPEAFLGLSIEALVPQESRKQHVMLREKFALDADTRPMGFGRELYAMRASGSTFPVEVALASMEFGEEKFVIASVIDISTYKAAEAALKELSRLNAAILDSAAVSMISTTPDGVITSFNCGAELLLGYSAAEMIQQFTPAIIHDENEVVARANAFSEELGQVVEPGFETFVVKSRLNLPNTYEWTYIRKNGERFPVLLSVTALRDEQHVITGFLGVAVDISERKAAEAELRKNEHFLSMITDNIPGLISYWNRDLYCVFANKHNESWFGKTTSEMVGQHMQQLLGEVNFNFARPRLDAALSGIPQHYDHTLQKVDGTTAHALVQLVPDTDGGIAQGVIVLLTDVTMLKQTQLELEAANGELELRSREAEAANRAKGDFLANMSHEIRTPMNAVLGLSQLLQNTGLAPGQRDYVERIRRASGALLRVLNDILDYSKIEAGHLDIESVDFRLEKILKHTSDLFSAAAAEKDIDLYFELDPSIPATLKGDPLRLGQVLHNLLGNAIKFTPRGEVHIKVDAEARQADQLRVRFSIRDTGIGITPEQESRLFQAFEQADTSTTRKYGGTGLGLSICKRLTELMGGEIGVSSQIHVGTTFTFSIQVGVVEDASPKSMADMHQLRALIVDDHPMSLVVLGKTLRSWGCETTTSGSSTEALRMIIEAAEMGKPFELILLDWQMPEMDGFELARRIEVLTTQTVLPRLPRMIMVTAHGKERTDQALTDARLYTILEKPVLPSQLYDAIADLPLNGETSAAFISSDHLPWATLTAPVSGAHILLAEDNNTNIVVASEFLRVMGMQVDVAVDGQEAVEKVLKGQYDLVLMDLQMPTMDGFEAVAAIRSTEKGRELPIVAMTAAAMNKDRQATEAAGMNDHIAKPINPELLAETLLKWLPKRIAPIPKPLEVDEELPFSLPGLDLQSAWQRLDHRWSLVRKVCVGFAKDFADAPERLDQWIQTGDLAAAARLAHTVKGLAPNLGANELLHVAADFEAELKQGQISSQNAFTRTLSQVLAALDGLAGATLNLEPPSNTQFDPASILPRLRELETMLLKKQGKARKAVKDIESLLTGSSMEAAFKGIVSKTERLKFEEALPLLQILIQQLSDFAI